MLGLAGPGVGAAGPPAVGPAGEGPATGAFPGLHEHASRARSETVPYQGRSIARTLSRSGHDGTRVTVDGAPVAPWVPRYDLHGVIGESIGNFRLVSRLGRGGMGEVYLGEQTSIGTKVAVKLLLPAISADQEHVTRFFNEARAVQRIQHAGIVKIFDVGFHRSGQAYLVMEYLEGESLARKIHRQGRLHPAEIADLGKQIASVLDATHSAGITHRDLKPDNIYLVPDRELASRQRAKVLDFGIAKLSGTLAHVSPQTIGTLGTPAYMAPEQWGDASKVDWRADIYSLGCVAFEMACGRPPFVVSTIAEACGKHLNEIPVLASTLVPGIPPELDRLLAQLLEKRPEARPQTMEQVAQRFDALAAQLGPAPVAILPSPGYTPPPSVLPVGTPPAHAHGTTVGTGFDRTVAPPAPISAPPRSSPRPSPRPSPRHGRRRWPLVVGGLVLVCGGAVLAIGMMRHRSRATPPSAEPFCVISAPPVFDGASTDPVELRYAFVRGQRTQVTAEHRTRVESRRQGATTDERTITLEGTVVWTSGETDGRFQGRLELSKISVDRASVTSEGRGPENHETVHWRSDDPSSPAGDNAPLAALLPVPLTFTISAHGELLASSIQTYQDLLVGQKAVPALLVAFSRDEVFRTMFARLPDKRVKVGDTWRAGELVRRFPGFGDLSAKFDLRVQAISKDGQQVLLQAAPELSLDLAGTVTLRSKQTALAMWSQFDVGRHEITASAVRGCAKVSVDTDAGHTELEAELVQSYDTQPLGVTPPSPPPAIDAGAIAVAVDAAPRARPDADVADPPDQASLYTAVSRAAAERSGPLLECTKGEGRQVTLTLTISAEGRVTDVRVAGAEPRENACIAKAMRGLTIPRLRRGPGFTVNLPLVIVGAAPVSPSEPVPATNPPPRHPVPVDPLGPAPAPRLPDATPDPLSTLHSADAEVLACGDRFLGSTQSLVAITIAPDGSVSDAKARAEPPPLRTCVEGVVKALRFAPSNHGRQVSFGYKVQR